MRPAPNAATHTAIPVAIGTPVHPLNIDSADFRTIPLKTNSSKIPPSSQATTIPMMSLTVDSCIARKDSRVGGLANHRDANRSAKGLYANINPNQVKANASVDNHEWVP